MTEKNKKLIITLQKLKADIQWLRLPVVERMVQGDEIFEEHGIDGVKGYNKAIKDVLQILVKEMQ